MVPRVAGNRLFVVSLASRAGVRRILLYAVLLAAAVLAWLLLSAGSAHADHAHPQEPEKVAQPADRPDAQASARDGSGVLGQLASTSREVMGKSAVQRAVEATAATADQTLNRTVTAARAAVPETPVDRLVDPVVEPVLDELSEPVVEPVLQVVVEPIVKPVLEPGAHAVQPSAGPVGARAKQAPQAAAVGAESAYARVSADRSAAIERAVLHQSDPVEPTGLTGPVPDEADRDSAVATDDGRGGFLDSLVSSFATASAASGSHLAGAAAGTLPSLALLCALVLMSLAGTRRQRVPHGPAYTPGCTPD